MLCGRRRMLLRCCHCCCHVGLGRLLPCQPRFGCQNLALSWQRPPEYRPDRTESNRLISKGQTEVVRSSMLWA